MKHSRRIAAGAIALLVAAVPVVLLVRARAPVPDTVVTLRLGIQDNVICALPLIAVHEGLFRDNGLAVDIVPYPSGKLALNAMFAGEVHVATVADMPIMANSFRREDYAVFATIAQTDRGAWLVAADDRGISEPNDLTGRRVATQRNSAVHFFLSAFLQKQGIAEDEIDLVFMPAVELPGALVEGRIDAFSMRNPFIREARDRLGGRTLEWFDPDIYRQTFNLVTWRERLRTDPRGVHRLLRALAAAERLLIRDRDAALAATVARLGAERAEEIRADWDLYTFSLTLDQSLFITLEDQARWALERNPELGDTIPNFLDFVDTGPLCAVKPEAVSVIR